MLMKFSRGFKKQYYSSTKNQLKILTFVSPIVINLTIDPNPPKQAPNFSFDDFRYVTGNVLYESFVDGSKR